MNFCIEKNTSAASESQLDAIAIKKYLDTTLKFNNLTDKQIKTKIIEIINNTSLISNILDELDITYKYFIQLLYINYTNLFTTSFINKHIKGTYNKYQDL